MSNRNLIASLVLIFAAGGLWAGCTVGFSAEQEGVFPCDTKEDCLADYICADDGLCRASSPTEAPPCDDSENGIDQDGDGFGSGNDRANCVVKCQERGDSNCEQLYGSKDCNDNDADVYPFAPELCDGQVNDCSLLPEDEMEEDPTEADVFSCTTDEDCPDLADEPTGVTSAAGYVNPDCNSSGKCVYLPFNELDCAVDGNVVKLTCASGTTGYSWERDSTKTYADLPAECREE